MNSKKLYLGLTWLLVLLGAGILFSAREANSLLENQSRHLVRLKASYQATADQQAQLAKDRRDISTYAGLDTIAKSVVPQDKDQAEAVRQIVNLAGQSGIPQLGSIAFPPSALGGGTHPDPGAGRTLTQVTPVKGIPGVYDLQITVSQDSTNEVPYGSFINFLSKLEQNRRTAQVNSIDIQPDQKNPDMIAFTLVIDEFIKP